jgi:hypothetical protein
VPRKRPPGKSRQTPHAAPPAPAAAPARVRRPPPYIKCLQRTGRVAVWQVDGAYVRKHIDGEFGVFGHHYSFGAIPRNEIWLDAESEPGERGERREEKGEKTQPLLIRQAIIERRLMTRGMDYEAARTVAIAEERRERMRSATADRDIPDGA